MYPLPSPGSVDSVTSSSTPSASQRSKFPFPPYGGSPRPSISGGYPLSRSSTAGSINAAVDTTTVTPVNELSNNAISTLLSPPIVRTGLIPHTSLAPPPGHRAPTARDITPVSLTTIPHVDSSAFKSYISQVGPVYESFKRAKLPSESTTLSPNQIDTPRASYFPDAFERRKRSESQSSTLSLARSPTQGLSPPVSPSTERRPSSSQGARRGQNNPTPLSTIPSVYFEENFQLENPRTFDIVSERSDIIPQPPQSSRDESKGVNGAAKAPSGRKALHTNAILQEKLSWYMDTVEVHLISSIATASTSFFAALGSLKELQAEATDSISKIKSVRSALKTLDNDMAVGGLAIVNLQRRRDNLGKLAQAVDQLCQVVDEAKSCDELVEANLLDDANTRLDALEGLISGSPAHPANHHPPRIDLRRLNALSGITEGIAQLKFRIAKGFESRFIDVLLADLRQHVQSVPANDTIERWASTTIRARGEQVRAAVSSPAYLKSNDQMRSDLLAALAGLKKVGSTARVVAAYREAIMREVKSMIRRHLPSASDDDGESVTSMSTRGGRRMNNQEKSVVLSRNLRALDAEGAEELLIKIYTDVGEALRRLGVQVKVVLDVTSMADQPKNPKSPPMRPSPMPAGRSSPGSSHASSGSIDEVTQILDLSSLLGQAVDNVHAQVIKILRVRSDQTSRLSLHEFLRFFTLNKLFADECEGISGRSGDTLKEAVNASIKDFLQSFTDAETQRIVQVLEVDKWEAKDVGPVEKARLERVLGAMTRTPKVWMNYTRVWEPAKLNLLNEDEIAVNGGASSEKARPAFIDEQRYMLVDSSIHALRGIESFLIVMTGIPSLAPDATSKLLEYLKTFNSRCCQLILGAGAIGSAGLKNILTKHLALASQTCSFIVALMPYIREYIRRQAPSSSSTVLLECDKVKRLFQDHQSSIHDKLVDIMSQRCNAHLKAMKKIDWDSPNDQETITNPYMEALAKETGTLHKVLARHVTEMDISMIMTPIFSHYTQEWTKAFREATVKTEAGKARMLRDVEHFDARVGKIEGSKDLCASLLSIVREKHIEQAAAPAKEEPEAEKPPNETPSVAAPETETATAEVKTAGAEAESAAQEAEKTDPEPVQTTDQLPPEEQLPTVATAEDSEPALAPVENGTEIDSHAADASATGAAEEIHGDTTAAPTANDPAEENPANEEAKDGKPEAL